MMVMCLMKLKARDEEEMALLRKMIQRILNEKRNKDKGKTLPQRRNQSENELE